MSQRRKIKAPARLFRNRRTQKGSFGFLRVATAVPPTKVAAPKRNAKQIIRMIKEANEKGVRLISFPECAMTAYTLNELYFQEALQNSTEHELGSVLEATRSFNGLVVVGVPFMTGDGPYNCGVVMHRGK